MEVKIGVLHTPREIVLETTLTPEEVESTVSAALKSVDGASSFRRISSPTSRSRRPTPAASDSSPVSVSRRDPSPTVPVHAFGRHAGR